MGIRAYGVLVYKINNQNRMKIERVAEFSACPTAADFDRLQRAYPKYKLVRCPEEILRAVRIRALPPTRHEAVQRVQMCLGEGRWDLAREALDEMQQQEEEKTPLLPTITDPVFGFNGRQLRICEEMGITRGHELLYKTRGDLMSAWHVGPAVADDMIRRVKKWLQDLTETGRYEDFQRQLGEWNRNPPSKV